MLCKGSTGWPFEVNHSAACRGVMFCVIGGPHVTTVFGPPGEFTLTALLFSQLHLGSSSPIASLKPSLGALAALTRFLRPAFTSSTVAQPCTASDGPTILP